MVIPYAGALSFFLGLLSLIPVSIQRLLVTSIIITCGVALIKFLSEL